MRASADDAAQNLTRVGERRTRGPSAWCTRAAATRLANRLRSHAECLAPRPVREVLAVRARVVGPIGLVAGWSVLHPDRPDRPERPDDDAHARLWAGPFEWGSLVTCDAVSAACGMRAWSHGGESNLTPTPVLKNSPSALWNQILAHLLLSHGRACLLQHALVYLAVRM